MLTFQQPATLNNYIIILMVQIKLSLDLYLTKILDTSTQPFFPCTNDQFFYSFNFFCFKLINSCLNFLNNCFLREVIEIFFTRRTTIREGRNTRKKSWKENNEEHCAIERQKETPGIQQGKRLGDGGKTRGTD